MQISTCSRWEWSSLWWPRECKSGSPKCCHTPFSSVADPLQWAWSARIISSLGNWSLNLAQECAVKTLVIFLILTSWTGCSAGSKHKHWLVSHMEPADLLCEVWIQRCFSPCGYPWWHSTEKEMLYLPQTSKCFILLGNQLMISTAVGAKIISLFVFLGPCCLGKRVLWSCAFLCSLVEQISLTNISRISCFITIQGWRERD